MKNIFTILSLILLCGFCSGQNAKMNFGAALAANDISKQETAVPLFVQGNITDIQRTVEMLGGTFRYATGDIASVLLKAGNIRSLASKPFVKRIEAGNPYSKRQVMNDTMLYHNGAVKVHSGDNPLPQAYKGDGVVMGFIDTGIDYKHPDFQDAAGKTRIKFLWDQTLADSFPPQPYSYGQEFTAADIDNGLATGANVSSEASYGHGTHVTSVACGNGLAIGKYKGVAPNADIIFVAVDVNNANGIADAANYIYAKALALGKPCALNVSLGDYYGSHDGKNLEAQLIKSEITAQPGRSFIASAGNAGTLSIHVGYTVSPTDTNFTWFSGAAYIAMYSDTTDFKQVKFAIGADKVSPSYSFRGRTSFDTIAPHVGVLGNDTIWNGSNRICTMLTYGDTFNGVNSMEFLIAPDTAGYFWRLMTTGTGKFDAWTFDVEPATLADTTIYPALKKYKQPDLKSNMVSSFQCLDEVITVGNYTNRNKYIDHDLLPQFDAARIPGKLYPSSSHGPTRDGRIKPDIAAPGDWTMAAMVTTLLDDELGAGNAYRVDPGGFHRIDGGTSNSSPGVAGIAGLYLQMQPAATWKSVKDAIINCARMDSFTGSTLPDNFWGYGKADAFAAMTGCATSINNTQTSEFELVNIYPNPASDELNILVALPEKTQNAELLIYDLVGQKVKAVKVKSSDHLVLRKGTLQSGIYFCTLRDGEKILTTRKIIISE